MNRLLNIKIFLCIWLIVIGMPVFAQYDDDAYLNKTSLVTQQIDLLKGRLSQLQQTLAALQQYQEKDLESLTIDKVNKALLAQAGLDASVAKSNLDSIGIELSEAQQTITRLEKDEQEIENQLNAFNVFGAGNSVPNLNELQAAARSQKSLLKLEKVRADSLQELQKTADAIFQLYKAKHVRIGALLKSQTMMQLKERQVKSELAFQQQESYWLQRLNSLSAELNNIDVNKDKSQRANIETAIFFANENINFTYLQMLIARYQDQIQQLKVSISRSSSITLLNKMGDQVQVLTKQITRVGDLIKKRTLTLQKRKALMSQSPVISKGYLEDIAHLAEEYKEATQNVTKLSTDLSAFRVALDQALKQELSSRQGLPGLGVSAWLDLGAQLLIVPTLTFQIVKNLMHNVVKATVAMNYFNWILLLLLEIAWIVAFYAIHVFLKRSIAGVPDHEYGHINLKWLSNKLFHRLLLDVAIIGNVIAIFYFLEIPTQSFTFFINLALVWILFKSIIIAAHLCLVETAQDHSGHDVRLYHQLKWTFLLGGLITALTVLVRQLPVMYEVKDLFVRIFLFFLLIVSVFLLRSWNVLPELLLMRVDNRHVYFKRIIRLMGLLIPIILLINSAIGLFGYVNFVLTISWYEGVFLVVLVGYLAVRGLLNDALEFVSRLLIRHVTNGWLWMEAFLKPIDKVLRVTLFLAAWVVLFLLYGWDQQSPVVERLNSILTYHLFTILNSPITPLSILELVVLVAVLFWAARWTREFVYRLLLSRTRDMGVRNSIAILSQYTMILIGLFICLRVLGIDFKALVAVAGLFAFGIGLGLRDIFNNFVCGFILLLERPLRVGDTVTIGGYEGDVIHIGGRAVTIRTWDHMEVLVPNAEIFSKTFTNWTARDNIIRTVISIKIHRHDNPEAVQAMIYEVLQAHESILKDPAPEVFLKELMDGLIEFEVRYFINLRQVYSRTAIRSEVLVAIWAMFEKNNITPPYPHHEIFLRGLPKPGN